jgi:flagellar biosynthesis chaperone FliJ
MSTHVFRLQRVQRVRAVEEEMERARFGEAEKIARAAEDAAESARARVSAAIDDLRGLQGSPQLAPASVMAALILVDEARVAQRSSEQRACELRAEAETRRKAWVARVNDLEGLQRLENRSREAFQREEERLATLAMDETASQRAAHARRARTTEPR